MPGGADPAQAADGRLKVFVDCQLWNCGRIQRFRERITFVEWVQLPQDADILVLWTGQRAGAGFQYVFDFLGQGGLEGEEARLTFTSSVTDVDEEVLQGLTRTLASGLVPFVNATGGAATLEIRPVGGSGELEADRPGSRLGQTPVDDPWDFWIFSARLSFDYEEEDQVLEEEVRFGASANRTTETWKIDIGFNGNSRVTEFQLDDSTRIRNIIDDWNTDAVVVRSITDHLSWGGQVEVGTSTRLNQDLRYSISPAVEWNYFPWQDATRRRFVVLYTAGYQWVNYEEPTVFNKLAENLWIHALDVEYRAQEPWGNARFGAEANQILNRSGKYSFEFDGNLEFRVFRGLNLEVGGSYEIIRDQIYLSGEGLSQDEIFLQQRQLATGSRLELRFGVNYRFGSIYNSIVNARFPSVR